MTRNLQFTCVANHHTSIPGQGYSSWSKFPGPTFKVINILSYMAEGNNLQEVSAIHQHSGNLCLYVL